MGFEGLGRQRASRGLCWLGSRTNTCFDALKVLFLLEPWCGYYVRNLLRRMVPVHNVLKTFL